MRELLSLLVMCLLSVSVYGHFTNKSIPLETEKTKLDQVRLVLAQTSIQYKIKPLIIDFLQGSQTPDLFYQLMTDIKMVVIKESVKGNIINPSIKVDEKKFLEDSVVHFELKFQIPPLTDIESVLTFEFKVNIEE